MKHKNIVLAGMVSLITFVPVILSGCARVDRQNENTKYQPAGKTVLLCITVCDTPDVTPAHKGQEQPPGESPFRKTADVLQKYGYEYDAVSDENLQSAICQNGKVIVNRTEYDTVVIPPYRFMEPEILEKLLDLAGEGATILFQDRLPSDVPEGEKLTDRQKKLEMLLDKAVPGCAVCQGYKYGKGTLMVDELMFMLRSNIDSTKVDSIR